MKSLPIAIAAAVIAVGTVAADSAQAALLDFNFTTENGATGSFTLDTDTPPSPDPALFRFGFEGFAYPNAVSDFSISAPYLNLSSVTTDYNVVPLLSDFLGLPGTGLASGVSYGPGCITAPGLTCRLGLSVSYSGDSSELPVLSDDPTSYSRGLAVSIFENSQPLLRESITNFQVVARPIPESDTSLSLLTFGIGSVSLLLKRKISRTGKATEIAPN